MMEILIHEDESSKRLCFDIDRFVTKRVEIAFIENDKIVSGLITSRTYTKILNNYFGKYYKNVCI